MTRESLTLPFFLSFRFILAVGYFSLIFYVLFFLMYTYNIRKFKKPDGFR